MTPEAAGDAQRWVRFALAALALNLLLTLSASPEVPWVRPVLALSPDLLLLVLVGAVVPVRWLPLSRTLRTLVACGLFLAGAARLAGLVALEILGRPLDPAGDLPHLGAVAAMLGANLSQGLFIGVVALFVLGVAGLFALMFCAIGVLGETAAQFPRRTRLGIGVGAAGLLFVATLVPPPGGSAVLSAWNLATDPMDAGSAELVEAPLTEAPDLGGADIYLIFVESYGVAAIEHPSLRASLAEPVRRWALEVEAAGFDYRSAQIQSPTFGGGSWRAHASVLSGAWVDREARYRTLLDSDRTSLVRLFAAAGYRTVAFEPGIFGEWPEGDWYGFDHIYDQQGIGYEGPRIGWWTVPDQFTLYALHQREISTASRPLFAKVSLIGSHIPYWPVPPYVTPWNRFDDKTAYEGPIRSIAHDDYRDLDELSGRYALSLEHQFQILGGFLREFVPRRALVAVIGDHQPPKLSLHDSDTWATPIHLFSRDASLLVPFEMLGFTRTLTPEAGTAWRMSDFPHDLAELFPPSD